MMFDPELEMQFQNKRKPIYQDPSQEEVAANEAAANDSIDSGAKARAMRNLESQLDMGDPGEDEYGNGMSNLMNMPRKRAKSGKGGGGGMMGGMGGGGGGMDIMGMLGALI